MSLAKLQDTVNMLKDRQAQRELILPKPEQPEHQHQWHRYKERVPLSRVVFHNGKKRLIPADASDYVISIKCESCPAEQKINIVRV